MWVALHQPVRVDIDALQAALDELRATDDAGALQKALWAEGWYRRRPSVKYGNPQDEIRANVREDPESGCWVWTGKVKKGYGQLRGRAAHRVSYEVFVGPIPEGHHIDHVCRRRSCVRPHPDHLEPVTAAENDRRARTYVQKFPGESVHNGAKRWCKRGHEYTPENTGLDKHGKRFCRACRNEWKDRWKARLKESQPARGGRWHVDGERWLAARDRLVPTLEGPRLRSIEVAALWGVSPNAFNDWKRRHPDLLRPMRNGGMGVPLLWSKAEVEAIMDFRTPIQNALGFRRTETNPPN